MVGYAVADARTGQMLEGMAEREALPPASTAKAITSLFALERLGPGHRFVTRVLVTGPVQAAAQDGHWLSMTLCISAPSPREGEYL